MEIIREQENGIEFYTIELTGQSGMSQTGLAEFAGVTRGAISDLEDILKTKAPSEYLEPFVGKLLTLEITDPTINGKPIGNLKIYKASYCAAVLKHYATRKPIVEIAVFSLLKFVEIGINAWIQEVTGWRKRVETIQPHTDVYLNRIQHMRDHRLDDDLWMIFREASELLLLIEKDWRVPINDYDILDGSIGKKWADYRAHKSWLKPKRFYIHKYRDQRGSRECAAFDFDELPYFRRWLREWYVPNWLPKYLVDKYGKQAVRQIYTEIDSLTDLVLELTEIKKMTSQESQKYQDFLLARQKFLGDFDSQIFDEA